MAPGTLHLMLVVDGWAAGIGEAGLQFARGDQDVPYAIVPVAAAGRQSSKAAGKRPEARRDVYMTNTRSMYQHRDPGHADLVPARASRRRVGLVLVDLDHTVLDWTRGWTAAARALVDAVVGAGIGLDRRAALDELRAAHVRHGTMDCAPALLELADRLPQAPPRAVLTRAAARYRRAWLATPLALPGAAAGLARLARAGCRIVGYTESPLGPSRARLALAGLDRAFDMLISSWSVPGGVRTTFDRYALIVPGTGTDHGPRRAAAAQRLVSAPWWPKGSVERLRELIAALGASPERTCVVGDHLEKDIAPARAAGAFAAWARYGTWRAAGDQALVDATCHWPVPENVTGSDGRDAPPRKSLPAQFSASHCTIDRFDALLDWIEPIPAERRLAPAW